MQKRNAKFVEESIEHLEEAVRNNAISEEQATQLKNLLQAGQLSPQALSQMLAKQYERMEQTCQQAESVEAARGTQPEKGKAFALLREALAKKAIDETQFNQLSELLNSGSLGPQTVITAVMNQFRMLEEQANSASSSAPAANAPQHGHVSLTEEHLILLRQALWYAYQNAKINKKERARLMYEVMNGEASFESTLQSLAKM